MAIDTEKDAGGTVDRSTLIRLVAEIVSAYVSNNVVRAAELPEVIRTVAASLRINGTAPAEPKPEPAVPIRRSVTQDYVVCLVCGKKQKTLKRHLATAHGLSPAQYREQFGLNPDYPMVAPAYANIRSEMAKKIGLGRKRREAAPPEPAVQEPAPRRRRSRKVAQEQTA